MAPDAKKQKLSHTDVLVRGSVNLDGTLFDEID